MTDAERARRLTSDLSLPAAAARVLSARGISSVAEARSFLDPQEGVLHDPFRLGGVPAATEKLLATCERGGRVVVFGDYDCDGIGALAILTTVLKKLGADARSFIPHRLSDGYGLRLPTLLRALDEHDPEGIVTVDCGITAVEPVAEAVDRGVYVIVTDHHIPPAGLPQGAVLVDPKLAGCDYPYEDLCGAGIAWKLAEALLIKGGERCGIGEKARRAWLLSLAKIAALSTIADMVPLTGENRVITALGLAGLADPRSPGLAALLSRSGVPAGRSPSTREVAFRIAPRLNASGRIDHAFRSLELLTTSDAARATVLADEIDRFNDERREVQERVVKDVFKRLEKTFDGDRDAIVVEAGTPEEGWHRGVLGIAASRVASRLKRPVLLLSREGDKVAGSGRTWGRTPLYERLAPVARRFTNEFGGHSAALGVTLPAERFEEFRDAVREAFSTFRDEDEWAEELHVDSLLTGPEVDLPLTKALQRFEPHGQQNPKPLFLFRNLGWDGRGKAVGESGLRVVFRDGSVPLPGVGWNLAELSPGDRPPRVDVTANVALDTFTGAPSLTVLAISAAAQ